MKRNIISITLMVITVIIMTTVSSFAYISKDASTDTNFQETLLTYGFLPENTEVKDLPEDKISLYGTSNIQIKGSFSRKGDKGIAHVSAVHTRATKMQSTITLQVYNGSSYVNSGAASATLTKKGTMILPTATFSVSPNKKYRIKIKIKATVGNTTQSSIAYRNLV